MSGYPARFFVRLDAENVQCQLCPRSCVLKKGDRGFCYGRQNIDGKVFTTYGRTSGLMPDPIEKKPLFHFLPGTQVLSFGTIGCNLGCSFCQNWAIACAAEPQLPRVEASPEYIAKKARQMNIPSVAFTYNEPVVFAEYVIDTAKACQELGVRTVAVTAGYISEHARPSFFQHIDAVNVDLKSIRQEFYQKHCSNTHLQHVLDTLIYLKKHTSVWIELTNLIIPGENDSDDDIKLLCSWITKHLGANVPLHFSAFHPDWRMTNKTNTPAASLQRARAMAMAEGLNFVYLGNIHDDDGTTTWCPSCKTGLIKREGFKVTQTRIVLGDWCPQCGYQMPGIFA